MPKQTASIFEILSRGQFICSNSNDEFIRKLYTVIEEDQNFDYLYDYFLNISFILEKGNEYYYFSRLENKIDLERKIEQAFKWIDILDFLKTFDSSFCSGFRFTPSDILVKLNLDAELKTKLEALKRYSAGKDKFNEIIEKILNDLEKDKFIEIENLISHEYKVLASFNYLEQLIISINISEDAKHEIPE
ncbi:MAG: hypothetical protein H7296_10420 [Bacteroidia bacterium]|nr:hypothetical protein [Bacteroidia bacterium]